MHQYQCKNHCHFHRQIQQKHLGDTGVQQVQSVQPVCKKKQNASQHTLQHVNVIIIFSTSVKQMV